VENTVTIIGAGDLFRQCGRHFAVLYYPAGRAGHLEIYPQDVAAPERYSVSQADILAADDPVGAAVSGALKRSIRPGRPGRDGDPLSAFRDDCRYLQGTGSEDLVVDSWCVHAFRNASGASPRDLGFQIRQEKGAD